MPDDSFFLQFRPEIVAHPRQPLSDFDMTAQGCDPAGRGATNSMQQPETGRKNPHQEHERQ
jgi:hypothetical protein